MIDHVRYPGIIFRYHPRDGQWSVIDTITTVVQMGYDKGNALMRAGVIVAQRGSEAEANSVPQTLRQLAEREKDEKERKRLLDLAHNEDYRVKMQGRTKWM